MLYIPNPSHDPYYNQAFEEFVFSTVRTGDVLLLWRNRPAVVCGSYQNVFAEVNVYEARQRGIAVVRRISGGGTVYHDLGNLNYTLITSCPPEKVDFAQFLAPVITALNRMGIPVTKNRSSDIAINGLKVSGSAQRMIRERILHHGTLLYSCDLERLNAVTRGQRSHFETRGVASVPWPVTNMIDHMVDRSMTVEQFQARLLECLAPDDTRTLTPEEEVQVRELAESRYRSWAWTFGKCPPFTYRRSFLLGGREYRVEYQAEKGVLRALRLTPEVPELTAALTGRRLELEEIRKALTPFPEFQEMLPHLI